jgi:preprotein translocase subunit SecE
MSARSEIEGGGLIDRLKMLLALGILGGGLAGYYLFPEQSQLLRVLGVVAAMVIAWLVYAQTETGRGTVEFISGSRQELRKMHWPTRQETVQTTMAVLFMVFLLAVFLWLLDMFLLWATRALTGQGV